jgi:hypothetical protein
VQHDRLAYSPKAFGQLIGACESLIFKRIREGQIRAVKDGRKVTRILRADAEAYLASLPAVRLATRSHKPKPPPRGRVGTAARRSSDITKSTTAPTNHERHDHVTAIPRKGTHDVPRI